MKLVFDTNILIESLRLKRNAINFIKKIESEDYKLFISSIVIFELFSGKSTRDKEQVKSIGNLLKFFEIVDIDKNIARKAGELYRDYSPVLQVPDYIVAATALELEAFVVTLNIKHFQKIPGIMIYRW